VKIRRDFPRAWQSLGVLVGDKASINLFPMNSCSQPLSSLLKIEFDCFRCGSRYDTFICILTQALLAGIESFYLNSEYFIFDPAQSFVEFLNTILCGRGKLESMKSNVFS
jgi:hypothetical protein